MPERTHTITDLERDIERLRNVLHDLDAATVSNTADELTLDKKATLIARVSNALATIVRLQHQVHESGDEAVTVLPDTVRIIEDMKRRIATGERP